MSTVKIILFSLITFSYTITRAQTANPLLIHSNDRIQFDKIDAGMVNRAVDSIIKSSNKRVKNITSIPAGKQTINNTLKAFDNLQYDLVDVQMKLGLITDTYEDDSTRNTAINQNNRLSAYY